jgi:tetratricopeptide (TPR) repeat protein
MKFSLFKRTSQDKKFQDSLGQLERTAKDNPSDLRIHIKIAELYLEHGKKKEAVREYLEAARAYEEKRLFQIAVAIYNHVISVDPERVDVYSSLADLHLRNGFVGDAVAILERLANNYYAKDMKYEATQVLRKISEIDPNNKFFKLKVTRFYESKDLSEEETLRQGPKDKWQLTNVQTAEGNQETPPGEDFFDLEAALQEDISINISTTAEDATPPDADSTGPEAGAPDEVFRELKTIISASPEQENPEFHFSLGLAYYRCGQLNEALDEFTTALPGMERKAECYAKMADCSMMLQRMDEAWDLINAGLKLENLNKDEQLGLDYELGLIYKAKGERDNALRVFRRIYAANKDFRSVDMEIKSLSS